MNKKIFFLLLLVISAVILFSCKSTAPLQGPQQLTIKQISHRGKSSFVTFNEISGRFVMRTDTLKPGQKIIVNFQHRN